MIERDKKYYLAGPMSGRPQYNIPMFDAVASLLRAEGYDIVSPAEMDSETIREIALADSVADGKGRMVEKDGTVHTWGDFLKRDVKIVADVVDGIIYLPGWEKSRGARLEGFVAACSGKPIFEYNPYSGDVVEVSYLHLGNTITDYISQHAI